MMSSMSQYLQPDYLMPTALDAKNSPLALLAQTCSAIGKDPSPIKEEKKKDGRDSVNSNVSSRRSTSPSCKDVKLESSSSDSQRSLTSPSIEKNNNKSKPPSSPIPYIGAARSPTRSHHSAMSPTRTHHSDDRKHDRQDSSLLSGKPGLVHKDRLSPEVIHRSSSASPRDHHVATSLPSSIKHPDMHPAHHPLYAAASLPYFSHPGLHGMDAVAAAQLMHPALSALGHSAHSALGLSSHLGAKPTLAGHHPGAPLTYTHVKTASGATTLVPVCRDPYCTNCQITMQSAQFAGAPPGACPAGCTQCSHDKHRPPPSALSAAPHLSHLSAAQAQLSAIYGSSHPMGLLPAPGSPYVCNWLSGSDYCGKRFVTSEELLQHLRSHTSSVTSESALSAGLAAAYPGLAALSPATLAAYHSAHYAGMSPALRPSYPRSLSPNSILSSRYHPYKSPLAHHLPPSPSLASLPPGLASLYSPYSLYSQRLGVAP